MSNNKLDQSMQSVEAMGSIKIDHAVPVRTHTPSHAVVPDQEQQPSVTCRKLVLIGIATIGICAALYALVKYYSDSSIPYFAPYNDGSVDHEVWRSQPEIRVHSSELWLTVPYFLLFSMLSFMVILVACATSACVMLCGKEARKKAVEAERVLQELRRDTKSDASLAIPVAPFTRRRCPVGQDSDCLHIDWVPPVGGGATAYHLQWREQQGQDEVDRVLWSSSVASEKIGVPYYSTKQGSLRTQTAYQFRVRAFSAVSERWGPWSSPSKPTTVRPGKGEIILNIVCLLVQLVLLVLCGHLLWHVFVAIISERSRGDHFRTEIRVYISELRSVAVAFADSFDYGMLTDDDRSSRF